MEIIERIDAGEIEIGQEVYYQGSWLPAGWYKVTGWFLNGRGKMCLEYGGRVHTHSRFEKLQVRTQS